VTGYSLLWRENPKIESHIIDLVIIKNTRAFDIWGIFWNPSYGL
jgi:hypothetical protein